MVAALAVAGGLVWWLAPEAVAPLQARLQQVGDVGPLGGAPDRVVVRTATPPVPALPARSGLTVQGLVYNGAGNPESGVEVRGCDRLTSTDAEGRFTLVIPPGDCALHALRSDGALPIEGPQVAVSGAAGEITTVLLSLPEYPQGFAGVFLGIGDDAGRVVSVAPGSQAQAEGIAAGHRVVAIDGETVGGLDAAGLWARLQGDAGTALTLDLETPGGERYQVVLTRELVGG